MKSHGKEDILSSHPLKAGHGIAYGESSRMPGMQISIEIGVWYG